MQDREQYYSRIIIWLVSFVSIFLSFFHALFDQHIDKYILALMGAIIPILALFLGKKYIFSFITKLLDKQDKDKDISGTWDINIEFHDENNTKQLRTGHLNITKGPIGYIIAGQKLHDPNNIETMARWKGTDINFFRKDDHEILIYIYETYDSGDNQSPSKIGVVVTGRENEKEEFVGSFHDFSVTSTRESLKHGIVRIHPE